MLQNRTPPLFVLISLCIGTTAVAQEQHAEDAIFFREQVWGILDTHCLECHGGNPERIRSAFRIDSRDAIVQGGLRGPAIDLEDPASSLLLEMVSWSDDDYQMPPKGKLKDEELAIIQEWVLAGAPWAEGVGIETATIAETEIPIGGNWWAWQPLERPDPPTPMQNEWVRNPIDAFVLARLEEAGLEPAPPAGKLDLIRRVSYDLTGLPPTPEEVEKFLADDSENAYERLVDRLLESPQHGIKWARHWLDLVRFAETDGYERDRTKPSAWRYRDWVVDAINQDVPWDQFLVQQLAGDEIPNRDLNSLVATGYYRLGIWDDEPTDVLLAQYDDLDSIIDVTSRAMLGMSVSCARCHDHKRDPILQSDYYRLAAIFRDLKPYKANGGNSINPENFLRHEPEHFGNETEALGVLAEYQAHQSEVLAELRELERSFSGSYSPPAEDGLVSLYRFEDEPGSVLLDSHGQKHGTVQANGLGSEGRFNRAIHFDGDTGGSGVRIPHEVFDDFTISFWMRSTSRGRGNDADPRWFQGTGLVDGEISGVVDDLGISMIGSGIIAAGVGRPETFINSEPGNNDGQWHHVALSRDTTTGIVILYVDGVRVDSAEGGKQSLDDPTHLMIGRMYPGGGDFTGDIDELRIHERPLEPLEVAALAYELRLDPTAAEGLEIAGDYQEKIDQLLELVPPSFEKVEVLCAKSRGINLIETKILIRGNPNVPGKVVKPGIPHVLGGIDLDANSRPYGESTGVRHAFSEWLVADDNPVSSRVAANRLWQHHFGRGIVESSDDFGRLGTAPTHPNLLDWLATELVRRDWSMKAMHRLLVTSNAYRMSNAFNNAAFLEDPGNNRLWRFDMRRLTAEELRDSILAASGEMNPELGGKSIYPPLPRAVLETASRPDQAWGNSSQEQSARRSLYIFTKRSLRHPFLEGFDQPDTDRPCSVRFATTVPTQSLTMLNSEFMNQQAGLMAKRLQREQPGDLDAQLQYGLEIATCRPIRPSEVQELRTLVQELETQDGLDRNQALESACLLILNLNEFMHVR